MFRFWGQIYKHMRLVLTRRHRIRIYTYVMYMYTKPFTIIAFQMAYGFHFLSFRNDFQRRFPFIFIHLHNGMHLEALMCACVCHCMKRRKEKNESALCQSLAYTRNQKLMWVKWLETEKPHD